MAILKFLLPWDDRIKIKKGIEQEGKLEIFFLGKRLFFY